MWGAAKDNKTTDVSLCVAVAFRRFISSLELLNCSFKPRWFCVHISRKTLPKTIQQSIYNQIMLFSFRFPLLNKRRSPNFKMDNSCLII